MRSSRASRSRQRPRVRRGASGRKPSGRKPSGRKPLTRERILQTALELLGETGVAGLSMRALATALGTAPMSLYRHVRSKDELLRALVATALDRLDIDVAPGGPWTERAATWMHAVRNQLRLSPAIVSVLIHEGHYAPALLRATNALLCILGDAGFEGRDAVRASREIMWSTLGFVSAELRGPTFSPSFYVEALRDAGNGESARLRAEDVGQVAAHMPHLLDRNLDEVFAAIVEHLLTGLAVELADRGRAIAGAKRAANR